MSVKNKQNSSVNFLVRAEFLTSRLPSSPPPGRPPLVITIPHRLRGKKIIQTHREAGYGYSLHREKQAMGIAFAERIYGIIVHFIVNLAAILFFSFKHFPGLYKIVFRPSAHFWYL